eukprot:scaffold95158_cov19-Prasinocladus_malaysianus.AAC.3
MSRFSHCCRAWSIVQQSNQLFVGLARFLPSDNQLTKQSTNRSSDHLTKETMTHSASRPYVAWLMVRVDRTAWNQNIVSSHGVGDDARSACNLMPFGAKAREDKRS